jgi:hypothetical protein
MDEMDVSLLVFVLVCGLPDCLPACLAILNFLFFLFSSKAGMPDGTFSNQKSKFG